MAPVHRQPAVGTMGPVDVQDRLQLRLQTGRNFPLRLGFQLVQQPHDGAPFPSPLNQPADHILQPHHLSVYPNNWLKLAVPFWEAELGLGLCLGNDQSESVQAAASEAGWPSHQDQSHHQWFPDFRRALGSAGAPDPRTCEHPSVWRRPAPGSRPHLRQWHLLRAAYPPVADQWKRWTPRASVPGPRPTCAFRNGWPLGCSWTGVFLELWRVGLERYDELKGLDWSWLSMDGAMTKSPLGGKKPAPTPPTGVSGASSVAC